MEVILNQKTVLWARRNLIVGPKTYECKDLIKKFGGRWNAEMRAWEVHSPLEVLKACAELLEGWFVEDRRDWVD